MKRFSALFLFIILTLILGCTPSERVYVNSTPSINVNIVQNVVIDPNNTSYVPLLAGTSFTGIAASTLGIIGIQVSLKTDTDTVVSVQQSPTNSGVPNWDITDNFTYWHTLGGNSWTVQAVNSYVRVVVTNTSASNQTYFRLQTALAPIVEAVPRANSSDGRLKVQSILVDDYGFDIEATPFNELRIAQSVKLAGTVFIGNTVDTSFISTNTSGTGTVTQTGGQLILQTGAGANGYSQALTGRRGRFVAGNSNMIQLVVDIPDTGTVNNKRRWGIFDILGSTNTTVTDGAYFQLNGNTFGVATMRGGVETLVSSGSFNGMYGPTYSLDVNVHVFEIYYSPYKLHFSVDGTLFHTVNANTAPWSNTVSLYTGIENINSGGLASNIAVYVRELSIHRFGPLVSAPIYRHISTATTTILKLGAGTLHAVTLNNPTNNSITIYDNTGASGTVIAVINPGASATPLSLPYHLDFYTGLTIVTAGSPDLTIIYE